MFKYVGDDENEPESTKKTDLINAVTKHLINKESTKALNDFDILYRANTGKGDK